MTITSSGSSSYLQASFTWAYTSSVPTEVEIRRADGSVPPATPSDGTYVNRVSSSYTSYNDLPVNDNYRYSYSIFSHNSAGYSAPASVTIITASSPAVPYALTTAHVLPRNATTVGVDWTYTGGREFTAVTVRRSVGTVAPASPTDGVAVADSSDRSGSLLDDDLQPGQTYSYSLFVHNLAGLHPAPATATVTTPGAAKGWSGPQLLDPEVGQLSSLSCPADDFCAAVDLAGNVTTFDGSTWSTPRSIERYHQLAAISCTSSQFCVALDYDWHAIVMHGALWSAPSTVGPTPSHVNGNPLTPPAISCVTPTFCLTTGDDQYAVFDGSSWTPPEPITDRQAVFRAVSCAAVGHCVAVATELAVTYDGGVWGTAEDLPRAEYVSPIRRVPSVSCPTASFCMTMNTDGYVTMLRNGVWHAPVGVASSDIFYEHGAVSCSSEQRCVASSNNQAAVWDGNTWSATIEIDPVPYAFVVGASCAPNGTCRVIDDDDNVIVGDGATWSAPVRVHRYAGELDSISCPTADGCVAVDFFGMVFQRDQSGWNPTPVFSGVDAAAAISCTSAAFCVAVGGTGTAAIRRGSVWGQPVQVTASDLTRLRSVSCASVTFCVAVSNEGKSYTFDGSNWIPSVRFAGSIDSVSCASATFCIAVSDADHVWRYDGATWTLAHTVPHADFHGLLSVSCSSTTSCVAVGTQTTYTVWDGVSWTDHEAAMPLGTAEPQRAPSITCLSATFCSAVFNSYAGTFDGSTWHFQRVGTTLDEELTAVGCTSPSTCVAVGHDKSFVELN